MLVDMMTLGLLKTLANQSRRPGVPVTMNRPLMWNHQISMVRRSPDLRPMVVSSIVRIFASVAMVSVVVLMMSIYNLNHT
jgi:hypothetical protein